MDYTGTWLTDCQLHAVPSMPFGVAASRDRYRSKTPVSKRTTAENDMRSAANADKNA